MPDPILLPLQTADSRSRGERSRHARLLDAGDKIISLAIASRVHSQFATRITLERKAIGSPDLTVVVAKIGEFSRVAIGKQEGMGKPDHGCEGSECVACLHI